MGIEDSSDCQLSQTQELSEEKRADIDTYAGFVCSVHFISSKPSALFERNSMDWAPTVNMGHTSSNVVSCVA